MANYSLKAENRPKKAANGPSRPSVSRAHLGLRGLFHLHYIFVLIFRKITKKTNIY